MENYNKRWIAILYYFLDHKEVANGDNIALSVGVSSRTIRNDIKELNSLLIRYDAEIVSEIGIGYFLKISDKQKPYLQALSELYEYQVITIRLIADFEILWQRRRNCDLYSDIHLCHIMTHYQHKDTLEDHHLADDLINKEEFQAVIEKRQYQNFQLGELYEFDVSDFTKVDYQPFLEKLKRRIEEER